MLKEFTDYMYNIFYYRDELNKKVILYITIYQYEKKFYLLFDL